MPGEAWNQTAQEWQELMTKLLTLKFGIGNFVEIPDTVHGDCGIEGFTRDGKAFQCYAAEEPLETAELTRKQKAKVALDIPKLIKNQQTLGGLLGITVLDQWMLVVPRWEDKSLLAFAESKIAELRAANLPFISPNIVPSICTGEDFAIQRQQLIQSGRESLRINAGFVAPTTVNDWVAGNDQLVAQLYRKVLMIRRGDEEGAKQLRDHFVKHFLDGQNALAKLRNDFPEMFEAVDRIKKDKEHFLATESLSTSALAPEHLKQTINSLESDIAAKLQSLDRFNVKQFVQEAVADWLLRCPLDFPNSTSHESHT
jgi:hypothetical protein